MLKSFFGFGLVAGAALLAAGVLAGESQAQFRVSPYQPTYQVGGLGGLRVIPTTANLPNRNYWVAPYLPIDQYAYNVRTIGRAYSYVPPYALGYNPYPNPIIVNPYPVYPTYNNYSTYNPYLSNYNTPYFNYYGLYR